MQDARLERLFERFRRHGDVPALGQVFDETAGELLRVAMGLVREPGEADDLLQETFLTAIERAGRYESGRRLVPWLLGILVHHARERRRLARRGLDAARLARGEPERPEEALLGVELEHEVERALAELSSGERRVLDAYLKHGKGAAEIALELGGSPGAVRMQIHRGLERLRKALPAGLALGAAGGALSAQGLDGVRAAVLRAGEMAAESLVLGAGSAAGGLASKLGVAGVLVGKKTIVAAVVAAAFLALFFTWRGLEGRSDSARASDAERVAQGERAAPAAQLASAVTAPVPTRTERVEVGGTGGSMARADALVGGLRGRLVERDGTPIAGLAVALLEIEEQALLGGQRGGVSAPPPRVFVAQATSGPDGVFELTGARPSGAMQALGVDLGGERPSVRVVDVALAPGELAELGDIVLLPTAILRGRVVDEDGEPVAGARVRVGELTDFLLHSGLQELGAGGAVGELRSRDSHEEDRLNDEGLAARFLFEVPAWLGLVEERLPFVTARTDARGVFEFDSAPAARVTLLVDRPGRMAVAARTLVLAPGAQTDVGELELGAGRTLAGRVLDAAGQPVAGAEVRGGRVEDASLPALFAAASRTDGEGRFRLTGISEAGRAVVIARRDGSSAWSVRFAGETETDVRLEAEQELLVRVVDAGNAPIAAPIFELRPGREANDLGALAADARPIAAEARLEGLWSLGRRAAGTYVVGVHAPGFAARSLPCELPLTAPLAVELARALTLEVRVVTAEDGTPLADAFVTVELEGERGPFASARTDAQGRARLEVPEPADKGLWVRAEHACFAPRSARVLSLAEPLTLTLGQGGAVLARADPSAFGATRHMLVLEYHGSRERPEMRFPMLAAFDGEGVARRARLPAGLWRWQVVESLARGEALGFLGENEAPREFASGEFELRAGETHEIAVGTPLAATAAGSGTGSVQGRVTLDGEPARGVRLFLGAIQAGGENVQLDVEVENGFFRFEEVRAGSYYLAAMRLIQSGEDSTFCQLGVQQFELAEREVREFTLEYTTLELAFEVVNEAGEPVAGASLMLWSAMTDSEPTGGTARSGRDGRARIAVAREGRYRLLASHAEFGASSSELEAARASDATVVVRLERGVPCSGIARLAPGVPRTDGPIQLSVRTENGVSYLTPVELTFDGGEAPFTVVGLKKGRHYAMAYVGDEWLPELSFELPEWGSTTLELVFGHPAPAPPR